MGNKETIIIQISAGRGPAECCWVVAQVLKVLISYLKKEKLDYLVISRSEGNQNGTLNSVLLQVKGVNIKPRLKEWEGTIQWIGQSKFRKFHKRKNWFVGVSLFQEQKNQTIDLSQVTFQSFRASGPGGQHRNKVETAIRATDAASGLSAVASDSKSQMQNKKNAIKKLEELMEQNKLAQIEEKLNNQWKEHLNLERGNPVKIFKGDKFIGLNYS